jgi:hypothetical protein
VVFDPNSSNNIGNAQISGIVLDPKKNPIQNKFNGTSNSIGIYSYSWTIPRTIKSKNYEVEVNASTVDPLLYSLKPGVTIFSVEHFIRQCKFVSSSPSWRQ